MRPYAVYVPLCVKAIISNFILYLKRKVAHRSQSSTKAPAVTKPQQVTIVLQMGLLAERVGAWLLYMTQMVAKCAFSDNYLFSAIKMRI